MNRYQDRYTQVYHLPFKYRRSPVYPPALITLGVNEMSSTTFGPPFDYDDADITLRSSDLVDFHVHKVILSISSPFFKSMFSLPQGGAKVAEKQNLVIDLSENSETIATLLTSIYPVESATTEPKSLDDMMDAFVAAKKYDMAAVSQRLHQKFAESKFVQDDPIMAFCVAYSRELGDATRIAARASLKHRMNLDNIANILQYINGPAFSQLYKFHRACSANATQAVSGRDLIWTTVQEHAWIQRGLENRRCTSSNCQRYEYRFCTPQLRDDFEFDLAGRPRPSPWQASTPFHNFITRSLNVLMERPCREAVTGFDFLDISYKQNVCDRCQLTLLGLPEFSRLVGEEVERRVSEVRHYRFLQHITQRSLPKVHLELPF